MFLTFDKFYDCTAKISMENVLPECLFSYAGEEREKRVMRMVQHRRQWQQNTSLCRYLKKNFEDKKNRE